MLPSKAPTLRAFRDGSQRPMTLEEVAALVRSQFGRKCTASHLSNVERGVGYASARLLMALAVIYGRSRAEVELAYRRAANARRERVSA